VGVELDNLNNPIFPTRGIRWTNTFSMTQPLNRNSQAINKLESDMVVYASLKIPARIVGVIKLGGGHIFNDSIEYFQALSLGQNNVLRGFRKNRFSGHSVAYGSLELRIKVLEGKSYVLPGQVGVIAFNDIGRVWYRGEQSRKWHNVIGGGLYYNPFNLVIVSATIGVSPEETVFNFSIGTKFNLTF
jgi:outer membrane protein assembly factor BamA